MKEDGRQVLCTSDNGRALNQNSRGFIYGGDYNPEQWLSHPEILAQDVELMKKAGINEVTMGVFSWAVLEPEEGVFAFDWLKERMDILWDNGISTILATPSGARPRWLAQRYPEVLRVNQNLQREHFAGRHNHCFTSPVYREKCAAIDRKLAETFKDHPGLIAWHISNEFGGECFCPLCQDAFRAWLKRKYQSIGRLNEAWYNTFWSHTCQDFDQIEAPSALGERGVHALNLDWRRFVTDQTTDFMESERAAIREGGSDAPVTTNFMYDFRGLNYHRVAEKLDFVSFDNYPVWGKEADAEIALDSALQYDIMRSIKKAPFFLMESCPSSPNWQSVSKLKKPGLLKAASLQALAHGSDSVQFFQIRQSRGSSEKFHGAVIDHSGRSDTRVFREVSDLGRDLKKLSEIAGSRIVSEAAVLFDWENRWALEDAQGPRNKGLRYKETVRKCYLALRKYGLNVDIIDADQDFADYKIVVVPMLYQFRAGVEEKIRSFVEQGGICVMTCWSGVADETDLCFLGGRPHGLMDVFGLRAEEIDGLYDWEENAAVAPHPEASGVLAAGERFICRHLCELVCPQEDTEVLAVYESDFYAGYPALTRHGFGAGKAYYVCAQFDQAFYDRLASVIVPEAGCSVPRGWKVPGGDALSECPGVPEGVFISARENEEYRYVFVQNFGTEEVPAEWLGEIVGDGEFLLEGETPGRLGSLETVVVRERLR